MLTFKSFIKEDLTEAVLPINRTELKKFDKTIAPLAYTVKSTNRKTTTIIIRAPKDDRPKVKKQVEADLVKAGFDVSSSRTGGSVGSSEVSVDNHNVKITYKPTSGGMSETTLNSTITELAPALAFQAKKKFRSADDFYEFLANTKGNSYGVYVNDKDAKAGKEFIDTMPTSSKFKEKMENAMAILDYLNDEHSKNPIKQVYWGYRAKPEGIASSHKGDLFIEYKNGNMIGVSLKAGSANSSEPQLNTYVNKFFDDYGRSSDKDKLKDKIYKEVHSKVGLPKNWEDRSQKKDSIEKILDFKEADSATYDALYDKQLEIVRQALIDAAASNLDDTIDYIKKQILKKDENVPLVVVKAYGKNYKFVTDEDALDLFMPKVTKVKVYKSNTSKQNWFIDLIGGKETITMNMSIRSNKPMPSNKIAQGFNLAVKFNGIKK